MDIYTSVRPFKASKEQQKAAKDYLDSMKKHCYMKSYLSNKDT